MGIFYKVPISGVTWGRPEIHQVIRSLFVQPAATGAREMADYIERQFVGQTVLVNSGRSALELALRRLRERMPKPRSSVLTPSLICRAVPDKIVATGFTPVFYDVARDLSPSIDSLRHAIRPDTVAVVFPYLYGKVVPVENVITICKDAGIALIEDCAASFLLPHSEGRLSGSGGDYVIFSFQSGKTVVAGSGGALVDRTGIQGADLVGNWTSWELRKLYLSKITFMLEEVSLRMGYLVQRTVGLPPEYFRPTMEEVHEISPLDCNLVLTQLKKWPSIVEAKARVLQRYVSNLAGCPHLHFPQSMDGGFATRVFVKFHRPIASRPAPDDWKSSLADYMRERGIEVRLPYFPIHRTADFAQYSGGGELPVTDEFYESLLEVPSQPSLREDEIDYVSESLTHAAAQFIK